MAPVSIASVCEALARDGICGKPCSSWVRGAESPAFTLPSRSARTPRQTMRAAVRAFVLFKLLRCFADIRVLKSFQAPYGAWDGTGNLVRVAGAALETVQITPGPAPGSPHEEKSIPQEPFSGIWAGGHKEGHGPGVETSRRGPRRLPLDGDQEGEGQGRARSGTQAREPDGHDPWRDHL